jgi:hypothetical protein
MNIYEQSCDDDCLELIELNGPKRAKDDSDLISTSPSRRQT